MCPPPDLSSPTCPTGRVGPGRERGGRGRLGSPHHPGRGGCGVPPLRPGEPGRLGPSSQAAGAGPWASAAPLRKALAGRHSLSARGLTARVPVPAPAPAPAPAPVPARLRLGLPRQCSAPHPASARRSPHLPELPRSRFRASSRDPGAQTRSRGPQLPRAAAPPLSRSSWTRLRSTPWWPVAATAGRTVFPQG